ncbi:DUF296 domain-containing protein [Limnobaculum zhutongyuii]|uniref:DUF296 domain-containing protein n=1 Tax=Limnobaculum zhutongyuii TaxID=2498113 RepID=A0A411WFY4_9GAMM|nr:PPC domain-containing DNA-binding protein [Limnobaculum zhutongyuii]QBH95168.1 DUF296 domain-containing protein [Limnobaculum zhutongyuii]TQS86397.1 DUF296 domain-containing protein [Limnobaculum zhutongyuii]
MNHQISTHSNARFFALRLYPGQELLSTLKTFITEQNLQAAFIAGCVGSLTDVALRFAGESDTTIFSGKFEVVSLIGTLEQQREHLHLSVSDRTGKVTGGHIMPGCTVRTTLELVLGELEQLRFSRQPCSLSGYEELVINQR